MPGRESSLRKIHLIVTADLPWQNIPGQREVFRQKKWVG